MSTLKQGKGIKDVLISESWLHAQLMNIAGLKDLRIMPGLENNFRLSLLSHNCKSGLNCHL